MKQRAAEALFRHKLPLLLPIDLGSPVTGAFPRERQLQPMLAEPDDVVGADDAHIVEAEYRLPGPR